MSAYQWDDLQSSQGRCPLLLLPQSNLRDRILFPPLEQAMSEMYLFYKKIHTEPLSTSKFLLIYPKFRFCQLDFLHKGVEASGIWDVSIWFPSLLFLLVPLKMVTSARGSISQQNRRLTLTWHCDTFDRIHICSTTCVENIYSPCIVHPENASWHWCKLAKILVVCK